MRAPKQTHAPNDIRSNAVALVVTDDEGKLLILWHRKYRFWTVPLGKIEQGEAGVCAAHREAFEELGIVSDRVELFDTIHKPHDVDDYSDITIALCRMLSYTGVITNREPEKHDRFQFLHPSEILALEPISFPTQVLLERFYASGSLEEAGGQPH